jgi:hypothetical protein
MKIMENNNETKTMGMPRLNVAELDTEVSAPNASVSKN